MTDNEIIKAWECCENWESTKDCDDCPVKVGCSQKLAKHSLDLINRQNAEIDRLKDLITYQKQEIKRKEQKYNQAVDDMFGLIETTRNEIAEVKTEAIKEFAEGLKEKLQWDVEFDNKLVFESDIDNLVKEMTEVNEDE